jgi:hypothetical protein
MPCTTERHVWQWSQLGGNVPWPAPPGLRCLCGAITPEDVEPIRLLEAEVARLTRALADAERALADERLRPLIAAARAVVAAKAALDAAPRTPDGYIDGESDEYKALVLAEYDLGHAIKDPDVLQALAARPRAEAGATEVGRSGERCHRVGCPTPVTTGAYDAERRAYVYRHGGEVLELREGRDTFDVLDRRDALLRWYDEIHAASAQAGEA